MSLLPLVMHATSTRRNNVEKTANTIIMVLFLCILAISVFLALRDMSALQGTAPKMWLLIFAVLVPEVYVVIHGLSSSSLGMGFFSETLVDIPAFGDGLGLSHSKIDGASAPDSFVQSLGEEISKAAHGIQSTLGKAKQMTEDSLHEVTDLASRGLQKATSFAKKSLDKIHPKDVSVSAASQTSSL